MISRQTKNYLLTDNKYSAILDLSYTRVMADQLFAYQTEHGNTRVDRPLISAWPHGRCSGVATAKYGVGFILPMSYFKLPNRDAYHLIGKHGRTKCNTMSLGGGAIVESLPKGGRMCQVCTGEHSRKAPSAPRIPAIKPPRIAGIYGLYCKETNKWYIGQSKNLHYRLDKHMRAWARGFNEHIGLDNRKGYTLTPYILETVKDESRLTERECYWMLAKDSIENGYNGVIPQTGAFAKVKRELEAAKR